jgi:hypothetical protein
MHKEIVSIGLMMDRHEKIPNADVIVELSEENTS